MSLLRTEPPAPVHSLNELFAIAEALEKEAASRYAELAAEMRAAGMPTVAATFEYLAAEERGHADHVTEWSRARTGAPPDPAMIRWQPPETFDEDELRDIASSSLATAYRALSMAVRNEERAFALWTYIAAQSKQPQIREAAERMAGEELRHAALLRRERRGAFHAERQARGPDAAGPRKPPEEEGAQAEGALAALLGELGSEPGAHAELRRLADESDAMAQEAALLAASAGGKVQALPRTGSGGPADLLAEALRWSERAIEAHLAAADAAESEETMARLQALAARAIARAAALRQLASQR